MIGAELGPGHWLLVTALGALVGLDGISWPQAMLSRPIASGTLGGLLFGDPAAGFLAGALLELLTARHPPFGAARYPETGPAGLVVGSGYALTDEASLLALVVVTVIGWTIGWIGSHSIHLQRKLSGRLVGDPAVFAGRPEEVARRHRLAMRIDAARAALITGVTFVPAVLFARLADALPPGPGGPLLTASLVAAGVGGLAGAGARVLGGRATGWSALAAGAMVTTIIVVLVP